MAKKKDDGDGIPYMTDAMKRALDKGKDLPIEQLVSGPGGEFLNSAQARRRAPVRAGNLRPISKEEAQRRTTFDGETMPMMPATRRVIPEPFKRERIELGHHGKAWVTAYAMDIRVGDIIPGVGRITTTKLLVRREEVAGHADIPVGEEVGVLGAGGVRAVFDATDQVRVFREVAASDRAASGDD